MVKPVRLRRKLPANGPLTARDSMCLNLLFLLSVLHDSYRPEI